ncbi:MAG: hypothetical protein ACLR4Z_06375 [Butyricicoccaceae bacterium]
MLHSQSRECSEVYDCRSTEHALELAFDHASPKDCILVCGSLFLTGEAEKILRGPTENDEIKTE